MATLISTNDITRIQASVSQRRSLYNALVCSGVALAVYAAFMVAGSWQGQPIMPLDDAYIHFQYARSIATGQPYAYNPGLPPTSGATSFLYPYILAIGYLIGFTGLNLGWWATGVGALALATSAHLIYRLSREFAPEGIAWLMSVVFILSGEYIWHAVSGMETALVVALTLWTLYATVRRDVRLTAVAGMLLALIRPEGGMLAVIAAAVVLYQAMQTIPVQNRLGIPRLWLWRREWLWLLLPVLALGMQPLVNALITGTAVASGNAAKSLFGMIPFDLGVISGRLWDNFSRMELQLTGLRAAREPGYYAPILFLPALLGLLALFRWRRFAALVLSAWLLLGFAAIATLDTAFWHFKRYQMPLIALLYPLAAWGIAYVLRRRPRSSRLITLLAMVTLLLFVPLSTLQFVGHYRLNTGYVAAQPLQMANWLRDNTPEDSIIAVHDVGMMRYMGGRTTVDMVGLTTPGAADYWRNGPGSVGEFLEQVRPDYIASYGVGHGLGLGYLENTDLYAEALIRFPVTLDPTSNVALAAEVQGIYRPNWETTTQTPYPVIINLVTPYIANMQMIETVDVADLESERRHDYRWSSSAPLGGFPTEYNQFDSLGCVVLIGTPCALMDGGRHINGEESFTLHLTAGQSAILITRVHAANVGEIDVYVDDTKIATRLIPSLPGSWTEIPTLIPAQYVSENTRVRIVPRTAGDYMPYMHWAYQGEPTAISLSSAPLGTYQDGAIEVFDPALGYSVSEAGDYALEPVWYWRTDGRSTGNLKMFVHVLDESGQIVTQSDMYPGAGALPPANWIPGSFRERITLEFRQPPPGRYTIVMGLYEAVTITSLMPVGGDEFGRLVIGEFTVDG